MPVFESHSEDETCRIAADIAASAADDDVFLLNGTLGAGKSVFARAFIQSLTSLETEVPSPTFTLVQTYDSAKGTIWHFDLYRLKDPDEIFEIGWEDALSEGIILAEWPERLGHHTPRNARRIGITISGDQTRTITTDGI